MKNNGIMDILFHLLIGFFSSGLFESMRFTIGVYFRVLVRVKTKKNTISIPAENLVLILVNMVPILFNFKNLDLSSQNFSSFITSYNS